MRIVLITPPMVQVNAPYPATACLAGFLHEHGREAVQVDAALELALRLFSRRGLVRVRKALRPRSRSKAVRHVLLHAHAYADTVESVIRFLQGKDPTLAIRIASRAFLPEGPRFAGLHADTSDTPDLLTWAFGQMGTQDLAVHLASLYLDDLTDAIHDGIDSRFELARYGEKLAASAPGFDGIAKALRRKPSLIDTLIDDIAGDCVRAHCPDLVGLTVPFPGNVYGAFRMARHIKRLSPATRIVMGGGYVNTELREVSDPRVLEWVDYLVYDEGGPPLLRLIKHLESRSLPLIELIEHRDGTAPANDLMRVLFRDGESLVRSADLTSPSPAAGAPATGAHSSTATPLYRALPLESYFSMVEMPNPMHRIWSCGRWNKLTLAHGCYWHRCGFCDTSLDYIGRYSATPVDVLLAQIESLIGQTGQTGFHFVDEAMPPPLLYRLSEQLLERGLHITWWGNVRFDKGFTPELAGLMARAGCVAVTGGLEAATDRLLTLLDKGFTLDQVTRVTHALTGAGIMVHAYLMYGCPSQTGQDTVDSLEFVRQLFEAGCIQSAYWHRFALTVHSPIYRHPERYGISLQPEPKATFARNEVPFRDSVDCDHEALGRGLRVAVYNYMHGIGLNRDPREWFDLDLPPSTLQPARVAGLLVGGQ
jgi:radical SAM superfamily enzyme YgiQ (UPF0313 family)